MTSAVVEQTSSLYKFSLVDENQQPVPLSIMVSLTMTLYDRKTNAVINDRGAVDVLNANGGTYATSSGAGTFKFTPDDHVILGDGPTETHVALFEAAWTGPGKTRWELIIQVQNLNRVPSA